jgi:hypothetical protein
MYVALYMPYVKQLEGIYNFASDDSNKDKGGNGDEMYYVETFKPHQLIFKIQSKWNRF